MTLGFHVADSLTGTLIGRLYPTRYDWTDPLVGSAAGSLTVPLPRDPAGVARLRDLLLPRLRQIVVEDDGVFVLAGPIPRRATRTDEGRVAVPLADWRLWFYRRFLRPVAAQLGGSGDYLHTQRDQGLIMQELMQAAGGLAAGMPHLVVDTAPVTGVNRDATFRELNGTIGQHLDEIRARNTSGCDWYTYTTRQDAATVLAHAAVGWPERTLHPVPVRLDYRSGRGGNVHAVNWPEGGEVPTSVFALGEGQPPDQARAHAHSLELPEDRDLVWEETTGPHSGVTNAPTAFTHALARLASTAGEHGQAAVSITARRLPVRDVAPGDRAGLAFDDGWTSVEVEAARIVSRQVTGGADGELTQTLTLDLADATAAGAVLPGEPGVVQ